MKPDSSSAPLSLDRVVARQPGFVSSEVDQELVMMSVETGRYYSLSDVAARIWQLLETSTRVSTLCDRLATEFRVERSRCEEDVLSFLGRLADEGLIETDPSPEP